ncbi:metallophosphoesterase [Ahrensia sp. R2A130]|uniref:metallophosphoesterase family protein n=1 Tax=Ahrensia sp. R2A130 TaxID=744979 RepID=UPI0001E0F8A6|nr:metallophosphoesterase [Ahrensia sp. R2A130]EFL89043.1 metallophosphoesterase [Ahrensia sp. R2A130]
MFKLAHISDVHLGPLPPFKRSALLSKRVLGYANWRLNRKGDLHSGVLGNLIDHTLATNPDHLAITGDLVNLALPEEIELIHQWLTGLGAPEDISVIPGNHDTYVPGALRRIIERWKPWMQGDKPVAGNPFPYRRDRGAVALIGTNSGRATAPFLATGSWRAQQDSDTSEMLQRAKADGQFRVVMIHHPPFPNATAQHKRLIGAKRFRRMIAREGAELILHGHTHIVSDERIDGPDGPVPVIGVPSASHGPRLTPSIGRPGARYNLFEISGNQGAWRCRQQQFGYGDGQQKISELADDIIAIAGQNAADE